MTRPDGWAVVDLGWGARRFSIRREAHGVGATYRCSPGGPPLKYHTAEQAEKALARIPVGDPWPPPPTPARAAAKLSADYGAIARLRRSLRLATEANDLLNDEPDSGYRYDLRSAAEGAVARYRDALATDLHALETEALSNWNRALATERTET